MLFNAKTNELTSVAAQKTRRKMERKYGSPFETSLG
jgi:hypothetical protein